MKIRKAIFVASFPIFGAASALGIRYTVTRFGHSFMQFGPSNLYLVGTIGAVHQTAHLIFALLLNDKNKNIETFLFHVGTLPSLCIIGLTGIAAKANLISARVSLFAGALMGVVSIINSVASVYLLRYLKKNGIC